MQKPDIIYEIKNGKKRFTAHPSVISDKLIKKCMERHFEENKVPNFDKFELVNLRTLSLSFQNITKIQNLDGLVNLETLKLDNNIIEKIENIGHLKKLKWLDLSFNCITHITGLESLTELQDLSLYNNEIASFDPPAPAESKSPEKLPAQNVSTDRADKAGKGDKEKGTGEKKKNCLEHNKKLNVLSLGNNKFETSESIYKFLVETKLKNLDVLNVAGNPFCKKDPDYKYTFLLHLDKLKYIDYELVDDAMRSTVRDKSQDYDTLLRERQEEQKLEDELKEKEKKKEELKSGFLDQLENMTKEIFEMQEFEVLKLMEGAQDEIDKFNAKVNDIVITLTKQHLEKTNTRRSKMVGFEKELNDKIKKTEQECKSEIAVFENKKKHLFREIDYEKKSKPVELTELKNKLDALEKKLLDIEMQFVEIEDEGIKTIKGELDIITNDISTKLNEDFGIIREHANLLMTSLNTIANNEQRKFEETGEDNVDPNMHEDLQAFYESKDNIQTSISSAGDAMQNKINKKSIEIENAVKDEKDKFVKRLLEEQYVRNRKNVKHVVTIIAELRQKIEQRMPKKKDHGADSDDD